MFCMNECAECHRQSGKSESIERCTKTLFFSCDVTKIYNICSLTVTFKQKKLNRPKLALSKVFTLWQQTVVWGVLADPDMRGNNFTLCNQIPVTFSGKLQDQCIHRRWTFSHHSQVSFSHTHTQKKSHIVTDSPCASRVHVQDQFR